MQPSANGISRSLPQTLFALQMAATLLMTGLIWFVQIVHYPLFLEVGSAAFHRYEMLHAQRIGWVAFPPMVLELLTALAALMPSLRAPQTSKIAALISATLVAVIWASTALVQVPLHNALSQAASPELIRRLVTTNWIRTLAWSARSMLLTAALLRLLLGRTLSG